MSGLVVLGSTGLNRNGERPMTRWARDRMGSGRRESW